MSKIRKGVAARKLERPYTRKSRLKDQNYVKAVPGHHIVRFDMGAPEDDFPKKVVLKVNDDLQIRHNALEAGRKGANHVLEKELGQDAYHFRLRVYPHHILRENPMATGAGADRTSEGMKRAFGEPIGVAAQMEEGQVLAEVNVEQHHIGTAMDALQQFIYKIPCGGDIRVADE